jgi:hypothetical protein
MNTHVELIPEVQKITMGKGSLPLHTSESSVRGNSERCMKQFVWDSKTTITTEARAKDEDTFWYIAYGSIEPAAERPPEHPQGYRMIVQENGVLILSSTEQGLFYGCSTWKQIIRQSEASVPAMEIHDWPVLDYRGIMLDFSRGRVCNLSYLKELVVQMASLKMNVLQLYIEHTFQFPGRESIWRGSGALSREELLTLKQWCHQYFIELQPNLQSFGHCNRILTTPEYSHMRESDLYWTLSPAVEETYTFLESLYDDYLPLFDSDLFNIDSDETYDLGSGKSQELQSQMGTGPLYLQHLMRVRDLAKAHGKRIMVFGDVIVKHPELIGELPDDIVFLDWIYDPREHYESTEIFGNAGKTFWVCPGTGSWNSLFPRQNGAVKNILGLVGQGIDCGAQGMLLCDWADHGGYTMPKPSDYSFALGAAASWRGKVDSIESFNRGLAIAYEEPELPVIHSLLASIYTLPALWSKNRSQCVIALFDEPLMGRTITGPLPPAELTALEDLPESISGVLDEESHHLMRPIFQIEESTLTRIERIVQEAEGHIDSLKVQHRRQQYSWIADAFKTMITKVRIGREVRTRFLNHNLSTTWLLQTEEDLRLLKQQFSQLQISFINNWYTYAKTSEIDISLTYFAHGLERLDYLQNFIRKQRVAMEEHREPDYALTTYQSVGYRSLPTY